jgi:hypothetical protein
VDDCETIFTHEMSVRRVHESPRVTKPYTDEDWRQIELLGHHIDHELCGADVRLTMGGEPTAVRPRRVSALRPGQVVSGRIAAALGARVLVAA